MKKVKDQIMWLQIIVAQVMTSLWRRGVVVIATVQLHSTKPELRFHAGSSPACGVLGIRDGEDL